MNFKARLENLRSKPDHIRKQIAFWSSFGLTLVIFLFWVASLSPVSDSARGAVASTVNKVGSPLSSLTASVGSIFSDIKDLFFSPKKVIYTDIEVAPGK